MMRCDEVERRLDDLIDGGLARADAERVDAHLACCPRCRGERDALASLRRAAQQLPREVRPARDLWPAIAPRLAGTTRRAAIPWRGALPVAATVALAVALAYLAGGGGSRQVADRPPAQPTARLALAGDGLAPAIDTLGRAAAALREAVEHQPASLAGETSAVVLENLKIIDEAIARLHAALLADPGNRELQVLLVATLEQQIDVLQRVWQMPAQV